MVCNCLCKKHILPCTELPFPEHSLPCEGHVSWAAVLTWARMELFLSLKFLKRFVHLVWTREWLPTHRRGRPSLCCLLSNPGPAPRQLMALWSFGPMWWGFKAPWLWPHDEPKLTKLSSRVGWRECLLRHAPVENVTVSIIRVEDGREVPERNTSVRDQGLPQQVPPWLRSGAWWRGDEQAGNSKRERKVAEMVGQRGVNQEGQTEAREREGFIMRHVEPYSRSSMISWKGFLRKYVNNKKYFHKDAHGSSNSITQFQKNSVRKRLFWIWNISNTHRKSKQQNPPPASKILTAWQLMLHLCPPCPIPFPYYFQANLTHHIICKHFQMYLGKWKFFSNYCSYHVKHNKNSLRRLNIQSSIVS